MEHQLYRCVEQLARLGTAEHTTTESAAVVLAAVKECLAGVDEGGRVLATTTHLLASVDVCVREDVRLQCGCVAVSLLHHLAQLLGTLEGVPTLTPVRGRGGGDPDAPPPPPHLLSLQQTQIVAAAARLALYTAVLAGMDQEAACFVKMSLARAKFILGPSLLEVPQGSRHSLLAGTVRLLVPVVKHDSLGTGIRQTCFPEVLSALLCLCFCPASTSHHPQDTAFFRAQLEALTAATDSSITLRHLLLLMGLAQGGSSSNTSSSSGRGWLGRTCNSLVVRRYLMVDGGLQVVVGAGLTLCDGQDVRRCQAVAALIAHARTPDLTSFYASVAPQVVAMLDAAPQLALEVVRVVVLVAGELAERSPSLATQHLGQPLLQPLTLTTQPHTPQGCSGASLTQCVARLHTLMIDTAPPTPALARLLQPALSPLLVIANMSVTHLRLPARHLITKYLSHLAGEDVVDTLVSLAGLVQMSSIPPVNPDLALMLDEAGGVKVEAQSGPANALEEDEATASCLSGILEDLGQPSTVLAFYKKLVKFLDFKETQDHGTVPSLLTEADRVARQFERARRVAVCVTLLSCLAESEKLTGDLFQDLSAAGPVVDGLLRAGCQDCQDEGLKDIQVSLAANVLILVTCYVSDRSLRKDMTSGDWAGLKALLPTLEMTEECLEDEGVRLMASQLRHMVATHGVFKADVKAGSQTQGRAGEAKGGGKLNSATKHSKGVKETQGRSDKESEVIGRVAVKAENTATKHTGERISQTQDSAGAGQRSQRIDVEMKTEDYKDNVGGSEPEQGTPERRQEEVKEGQVKQYVSEEKVKEQRKEEIKEEMSDVIRIKEEEVERQQETSNTTKTGGRQEPNTNTKQDDDTKTQKKHDEKGEKANDRERKNKKTENVTEEEETGNTNSNTRTKAKHKQEKSEKSEKENKNIAEKQKKDTDTFETAMEDLMSPLLPIRGHGILALAKLVEERDGTALQHGTQLLALFQRHLREEDSYLYLMAVRGLAALCDVLPEKVVGVLTQEFSVGRRSTEDRAKLAESLSRAARRLGPLLPHYRDHFINAFLSGVRDKEWLVRAASLSALGDVCKELRFSLGPIVQEVFSVLHSAVSLDKSGEVRRAAVLVVTMLLQGLAGDAIKVLSDVLRDLYRTLRHLEAHDPDQLVRIHSQLALQEVDSIMRRFFLPSVGLSKRIFVLDAPPPAL
uniref:RNA polymerase II assembly factor Rtp1 C-terminal domain-containing protein n=1 Tax=Scylla olivacea TaxID=85551 RepID=A0A0N7ZAL9_SCYOL